MTNTPPLSWLIDVTDLPDEGLAITFEADADTRRRLAKHAGILSVEALTAVGEVRPFDGGVEVRLRLNAEVTQACVVTLVPVAGKIDETILRRYIAILGNPEGEEGAGTVEIGLGDEDPPEPLEDEEPIDLGPVVTEHFVLGLNPYPRAPGAEMPAEVVSEAGNVSPFAALKTLKEPK